MEAHTQGGDPLLPLVHVKMQSSKPQTSLYVYLEAPIGGKPLLLKITRGNKAETVLKTMWNAYNDRAKALGLEPDPNAIIKSASGVKLEDPAAQIQAMLDRGEELYSIRIGLPGVVHSVEDAIEEVIHAPPSAAIFNQQGYPCEGKEPWEWILCEPIDDSIEAIRNRDPADERYKLVRVTFVVDAERHLLAILILDLGHGMDRKEVKAWLTYAQDKDSRRAESAEKAGGARGARDEGGKEELGSLGKWGRGSKDAVSGAWMIDNVMGHGGLNVKAAWVVF